MSPTLPANPNRFSWTLSELRKYQTIKESTLYAILDSLKVRYLAQEVVRTPFFDTSDRPVAYLIDCIISDPAYESGIINVNGGIHDTPTRQRKDAIRTRHLKTLGWWVEDLANENVSMEAVKALLSWHKREETESP